MNQPIVLKKTTDTSRTKRYLEGRGIDSDIIQECIDNGIILEELFYQERFNSKTKESYKSPKPCHNIVFVGRDNEDNIRYASWHSLGQTPRKGIKKRSQKEYSFRIIGDPTNPNVHVFKSEIDLLSYATMLKLRGYDWHKQNMITLGGEYVPTPDRLRLPFAMKSFFKTHPTVKEDPLLQNLEDDLSKNPSKMRRERIVYLHFSNTENGKNQSKQIENILQKTTDYTVRNITQSMEKYGEDVNDILKTYLKKTME